MYHLDIYSSLLMAVRWRIHFSVSVFKCCLVVNWNYEGWRSTIMGLSSLETFWFYRRVIEAVTVDAMPCQQRWHWHAFLGWGCNMASCRAPWHERVSCAGEGQQGGRCEAAIVDIVDGRLLSSAGIASCHGGGALRPGGCSCGAKLLWVAL